MFSLVGLGPLVLIPAFILIAFAYVHTDQGIFMQLGRILWDSFPYIVFNCVIASCLGLIREMILVLKEPRHIDVYR